MFFLFLKNLSIMSKSKISFFKKKAYVLVTSVFFIGSVLLHWIFGWKAFKENQLEHGQKPQFSSYTNEALRDTFENWQSEFLQLIWQVAGLAFLWHVGSPQSKEGDERKEAKLDIIIKAIHPDDAQKLLQDLDRKYPSK
jgi:hypothetical protein